MPNTGEGVTQGTVIEWLKREGDHVDRDEGIVEVETEKVNIDIPAPRAGTLRQILVHEGDDVAVGEPLAYIEPAQAKSSSARAPAPAEAERDGSAPPSRDAAGKRGSRGTSSSLAAADGGEGRASHHSPAVLAIAREHHVDLSKVQGTGHEGRITRQDVLAYLSANETVGRQSGGVAGPGRLNERSDQRTGIGRQSGGGAGPGPSNNPAGATPIAPADDEILPISPTRKTIAEHMV
ncbi:MAG TPA: biotin/lipoyl-containing protein, partial [Chloroflexota bacterium]